MGRKDKGKSQRGGAKKIGLGRNYNKRGGGRRSRRGATRPATAFGRAPIWP